MKFVIDTNVVLDVLLAREEFEATASRLFYAVETGEMNACLCATTFTTIDYFISKQQGINNSKSIVKKLLTVFEIAPVTRAVLEAASLSTMSDFEDAVLAISAQSTGANTIITRNPSDFSLSGLYVMTPNEWWAALQAS